MLKQIQHLKIKGVAGMDTEYFSSINDVAKRLSVPAYTLRYWEKQFPSIIRPVTGTAGRRYYRQETVERLEILKSLLYDKQFTISGVQKIIREGKFFSNQNTAVETVTETTANKSDVQSAIDLLLKAKNILEN